MYGDRCWWMEATEEKNSSFNSSLIFAELAEDAKALRGVGGEILSGESSSEFADTEEGAGVVLSSCIFFIRSTRFLLPL